MQINVDFDAHSVSQKIQNNVKLCQKVLDNEVLKDSNYFCPMDTGTLKKSAILHTVLGSGLVVWKTPYADKMYYSEHIKPRTDKNPNASRKWFEVAKARKLKDWEKLVNAEYHKNDK